MVSDTFLAPSPHDTPRSCASLREVLETYDHRIRRNLTTVTTAEELMGTYDGADSKKRVIAQRCVCYRYEALCGQYRGTSITHRETS